MLSLPLVLLRPEGGDNDDSIDSADDRPSVPFPQYRLRMLESERAKALTTMKARLSAYPTSCMSLVAMAVPWLSKPCTETSYKFSCTEWLLHAQRCGVAQLESIRKKSDAAGNATSLEIKFQASQPPLDVLSVHMWPCRTVKTKEDMLTVKCWLSGVKYHCAEPPDDIVA